MLLFFTLVVALSEELLFRFIISKLAQRIYSYKFALILQAFIFSIIHLTGIRYILFFYGQNSGILRLPPVISALLYFILLFVFSIVEGIFVGKTLTKQQFTGNISYAIIAHWLANLIRYII